MSAILSVIFSNVKNTHLHWPRHVVYFLHKVIQGAELHVLHHNTIHRCGRLQQHSMDTDNVRVVQGCHHLRFFHEKLLFPVKVKKCVDIICSFWKFDIKSFLWQIYKNQPWIFNEGEIISNNNVYSVWLKFVSSIELVIHCQVICIPTYSFRMPPSATRSNLFMATGVLFSSTNLPR